MKWLVRPARWKYALALAVASYAIHLRWDDIAQLWQPPFNGVVSYIEFRFFFIEERAGLRTTTSWAEYQTQIGTGIPIDPDEMERRLAARAEAESFLIGGQKRYSNFFHVATRWDNPLDSLVRERAGKSYGETTVLDYSDHAEALGEEIRAIDQFFVDQAELPRYLQDQWLVRDRWLPGFRFALRSGAPTALEVHWPWLLADVALSLACIWAVIYLLCTPLQSVTNARRRRRFRLGRCTSCGYDRSDLSDTAACPECGEPSPTRIAAP